MNEAEAQLLDLSVGRFEADGRRPDDWDDAGTKRMWQGWSLELSLVC